jgi:serine/threonine-protein kinase
MCNKIGDAGYRIIEPIASGGMGQVFKAEHVITKRIEAIKVLSGAGTEEETDRFLREIQLQASLSHPNIAAVYNAFRFNDDLVMVMELVEGEPLRTVLQRGPLKPDVAVRYACEVLKAVGYAHANGVIHRDITPSNIVITPQGTLKLMDFGLAKAAASPSASQSGTYLGSPHYMSPEQVKDAMRASPRSDIYSLGAVLYEMATGRKVFEGDSSFTVMQAQVETLPTPPIQVKPGIPPSLNAAILTALAKDPAQRFADADAFRRALEAPIPATALAVAAPVRSRWQRPAWLVPVLQFALTCAVILLPTAFYAHSRRHPPDAKSSISPPIVQITPAAPTAVIEPPAVMEAPAPATPNPPARPSTPRRVARRAPRPDLTPKVFGADPPPPPAPVRRAEPFHPSASPTSPASAPAPKPAVEPVAKDQNQVTPESPQTSVAPETTQIAHSTPEDPADAAKEKKPHGRIRRALGKILSPFSK